jgi:hypothetical protein
MATVLAMTHKFPPVSEANPRLLLIEDRLGEPLAEMVAGCRAEGMAWARIAAELTRRTDIYITGEALRLWATPAEPAA